MDLDAEMTRFFRENKTMRDLNHNALNNSKVSIINQDAYLWVKNAKSKFDVIIIDFQIRLIIVLENYILSNFIKS